MDKSELQKQFEDEQDREAVAEFPHGNIYLPAYGEWCERKVLSLIDKAEAYDRLTSGGKKTLKEWANMFGMAVAVDQNREAACFVHIPAMYPNNGKGIWTNSPTHYGEETYLLPPYLIDFKGDWKDSLTLPDGWEEKCSSTH